MVGIDNKTRPYIQVDSDAWTKFKNKVNGASKHTELLDCFFIEYVKNSNFFDDLLLTPNNTKLD